MKKIKILVIAGYTPSLVNFRYHLLSEFIKKKCTVIACAPEFHSLTIKSLKKIGVNFIRLPVNVTSMNPIKDFIFLLRLTTLLYKQKPDIVFSYTIKPVIYSSLAAKISGVPKSISLITGLGFTAGKKSIKQKIANRISTYLYKWALKFNSIVFFQNPDDRAEFIEKKLVYSEKTVIVNGSGIDLAHFSFRPLPIDKPFTFLLIARLIRDKGIYEYAEAAKRIHQKFPAIRFELIGYFYKSPNSLSKKEIEEWTQKGIINFLGKASDVRPYINNCHVYVLPSYREGTPRSVLEAMAIGRPIITTDVPGCRETVENDKNGYLVKDHDVNSLVEAMLKIYSNQHLLSKMGQHSRYIAEKKYDVHKINSKIISTIGF